MKLVVVESPAKAKTINKYLGSEYRVLASYGHVRDLPPKDGSVDPERDFAMSWEIGDRARERVNAIAAAMKEADQLFLATDPDREGEAISWHVKELLEQRKALAGKSVKRVVFNEITKSAVLDAMAHPRELNAELIEAYLARRALDYLVGFTLSPVLWRKLPGSRSAGRVQSVALRLICEREAEIEAFRPREYWSVDVTLASEKGEAFEAHLSALDGKRLGKFDLADEPAAKAAAARAAGAALRVRSVERKETQRRPYPPFTTSTLQQEASRKLGFGAARTMRLAQDLYEGVRLGSETVGLITYMRTDSVHLAAEAIRSARDVIARRFGGAYLPAEARHYKSKAKNAQEAHEAVRPTDLGRTPDAVARALDSDHLRLYELIWKRALASQMSNAVVDQVAVDLGDGDGGVTLRATGSTIRFDGFLTLYQEDRDDPEEDGAGGALPPLNEGERAAQREVRPEQHFTQPPPRYTEASLVKRLEELGIGRPSTYASTLQTLQDRSYVVLDRKRLVPQDRGRVVTSFLSSYFHRYVEYDFTAQLEDQLDDISAGRVPWKKVLRDFWKAFKEAVDATAELRVRDVLDRLDEELGPHFFRPTESGADPRRCPACGDGRLGLKLGRYGAFIGCSRYPECKYTTALAVENRDDTGAVGPGGSKPLGIDEASGLEVTLRRGPYGYYVQLGVAEAASKEKSKKKAAGGAAKPKRASIPKAMNVEEIDLGRALALLSLPREIGKHPETGEMITAGIGRFGPYLLVGGRYVTLKGDDDVLTIGLNRAVTVIAEAPAKKGPPAGRALGDHPGDGKPIVLRKGRYGPYVQHGSVRATLPKDAAEDDLTLDRAVVLLAEKGKSGAGKAGAGKAAAKSARTAAPKKASAKKTNAKKPGKPRKKPATPKRDAAPGPTGADPADTDG